MKKALMILAMITSIATFAFPVNVTAAVDNSTLLSTDITEDETQVQTNLQFSIRTFAYNILDNNGSTILTCIGTPTTDFSGLQITAEPEENITIGEPFKQENAYCAQIKGQKPGTVTITAKTANGLSAVCKLNVLDHTFDFLESNEEYDVGESYNMTFFTDDSEVQFTIEDESIAKLESVDVRQTQIGLVIDALSVGNTTITALGKDGRNKSIVIHIVDPSQTNPTQEPTTFPFDKPTEPAEQLPTDYADDVAPNTDYDGTPMKVGETRRIHLSHRFGRKLTNVFLQENYNDTKGYLDWVFDEDTSDLIVTALKANDNLMVDIGARECAFTQHFIMQILEEPTVSTIKKERSDTQELKGDLNSDGIVDILDVIRLNKSLLGVEQLTDAQTAAADVDGNGKVESNDSLLILKYALEMVDSF